MFKKNIYITPELNVNILDNEISLIMMSYNPDNPPEDPTEDMPFGKPNKLDKYTNENVFGGKTIKY